MFWSPKRGAVLVSSGCYNRIPQTLWFMNKRSLSPPVLEAGKAKVKESARSGFGEGLFWVVGCQFPSVTSRGGTGRELSGASLTRARILFTRTPPQDLTTSQRPRLLVPSPGALRFSIGVLGEHRHSDHSRYSSYIGTSHLVTADV